MNHNQLVILLTLLIAGINSYATKMDSDVSNIFLSKDGKRIEAAEAYRSEDPVYECIKKEVHFNKRTGKPTLKKAD